MRRKRFLAFLLAGAMMASAVMPASAAEPKLQSITEAENGQPQQEENKGTEPAKEAPTQGTDIDETSADQGTSAQNTPTENKFEETNQSESDTEQTLAEVQNADETVPDADDIASDLLARYPLEADTADISGNGKNAAVADGATNAGVNFENDALNLAGGDKSSKNYVSLPDGLFDAQDTVSVSLWINNVNTKGNYAAFYFGSAATGVLPANYFLLNPCNPGGNYKAAFTDSVNAATPWSTEVGITNTSTTDYMNRWAMYTVVINEKEMTAYLNGKDLGSVTLSRTVSDLGSNLKAHIGKSQYLEDPLFHGSFRDLRIYSKALSSEAVHALYSKGTLRNQLLDAKAKLDIGETSQVVGDLTLPTEGENGVEIRWTSSNEAVVSAGGTVTLRDSVQTAVLTATLTREDESVEKQFTVTTAARADVVRLLAEKVQVPYAVAEKMPLPTAFDGGITVSWDDGGKGLIQEDGTVKAPEQNTEVEVTAHITAGSVKTDKQLKLLVMEQNAEYVMGYTRKNVLAGHGGSLHLALGSDNESFEALHNNTGIYFTKADLNGYGTGTTRTLKTPYLFRMVDGALGVVAVRDDGKFLFAKTADLLSYEEKLLDLHTNLTVSEPACEYDGTDYVISWKGSDGKLYRNTTKDFETVSDPVELSFRASAFRTSDITNAVPGNVIPVTAEEARKLRNQLLPVENTGVKEKSYAFQAKAGTALTKENTKNATITAEYSDGTTDEIAIDWDYSSVDFYTAGTYTITGKAKLTNYPVLSGRADPDIVKYKGKYYFIATGETQNQSQICIREADTPLGLFSAADHELLANTRTPNWAPELHEINGKLYLFLAVGSSWKNVQSCVMELKEGGDPKAKADWKKAVKVTRKDGSALYNGGITLDMTYFEVNGTHYVCWAQRQITSSENGTSDLWIATIDPENPYRLTSDPACILRCRYGWDRVDGAAVDEGPYVIQRDGKIYMTFSGSSVSNNYVVGLLTAEEGADLLKAESWIETNYPILTSESAEGEKGPGHSCFSVDEDGRTIFVYHMKPNGGTRSATVRRVHWSADGSPRLDMEPDQELKAEYRTVTATVTVAGDVSFDAEEDLLAHYKLEKDAKDSSGQKNDAAVNGKAIFEKEALVLTGGAKSAKNYVQLPTGFLDGQDSLTIAMWIKNNGTQKNTAAFSINGTARTGSYPTYYFLLNPTNPSGYYKAVYTDPEPGNTANPWNTEVGVNGTTKTSDRMNEWLYYTITISKNAITAYLDGKQIGTAAISHVSVSDFGKNLTAYLGASEYGDDTFAGSFRDVRIYGKAMTEVEAGQLYRKALEIQKVKEAKLGLTLEDGAVVYENLELPTASGDCTIQWTSDKPEILAADGTVKFPKERTRVRLTAKVVNGSCSEERGFTLTVVTEEEAKEARYQTKILIPAYISENLQSKAGDEEITWTCSEPGLIAADGKLTRPEQDVKVTVTAAVGDVKISRKVTVMSKGGQIASYVIQGGNLYENTGDLLAAEDSRRSDALYLAAKTSDEEAYTELNKGKAVVYVKWDGDQKKEPDRQMGSPTLFRTKEGKLAAAASGNNSRNGIYVWDTTDNLLFTGERFLTVAEDAVVRNPVVVYDAMTEMYKVFWEDKEGKTYVSLFQDLEEGSEPTQTVESEYEKAAVTGQLPENAVKEEAAVFEASAAEYEAIGKKYGTVYNTGVESVQITAKAGEGVSLPDTVTASYSDGSTKKLGVIWDADMLAKISAGEAGTYQITGTVQQDAYEYPFITERADPHIFYNEDDGYYYATGSYYEEGMTSPNVSQSYRKLDIRRAKTIEGLKNTEEHYILESSVGDRWGGFFWAPEFHKINGTWYCLVGAHDFGNVGVQAGTNWNKANWCSRSILIPYEGTEEQMKNGGMLDASQWGTPIVLNLPGNANASFDVTYYEDADGQGYYLIPKSAKLYMVKAAGGEGKVPQSTGEAVLLKSGEWPWEYGVYEGSITASNPEGNDQLVVEGPYMFSYGDKVYMSYSAATVDKYYTLGLMMADKGSDLMDPESWTNIPYPLLSSYDTYEGQIGNGAHVGGGHNSIVLDEYGNLALIYHARPYPDPHTGQNGAGGLYDPCRHTVVKSIHVAADGALLFNMTAEEELNPAYKTVTATVTVTADKGDGSEEKPGTGDKKDNTGNNNSGTTDNASGSNKNTDSSSDHKSGSGSSETAKTTQAAAAKTGDSAPIVEYGILCLAALAVLTVVFRKTKKYTKTQK
ncbi:family 43 glycosylhydrolase [Laedolimicola sp.]|uniref:family 43 glycosylhydrolase n=1 Tax=Laedolimicola sp. TaxID=2981663 RepID=UPI003F7D2B69